MVEVKFNDLFVNLQVFVLNSFKQEMYLEKTGEDPQKALDLVGAMRSFDRLDSVKVSFFFFLYIFFFFFFFSMVVNLS